MAGTTENQSLTSMRAFYESGATRSLAFRKEQLVKLRSAVIRHEADISRALQEDLKKSPEQVYATETGLLLAEINYALRHLHQWMRPQRARTNLVNFPSSGKIYRDPLGVVLIIAPWNYPFQLSLIPLAGAMAGGNCVLLKPSEYAPATAALLEKILTELYPPEYIHTLQGDGATLVPAAIRSFRFDHIFYTGSIPVGRAVYQLAAADLVPVTLELGGKNPAIVEKDADITITTKRIALAKFINAGQICVAPDFVLVDAAIQDELIDALGKTIRSFYGENPADHPDFGKIINEKHFDRLVGFLDDPGLVFGGSHDRAHLHIAPTIIRNPSLDSALMKEEIFGPILPVIGFKDKEEAIKIIRQNPNPLSLYVFTSNQEKAKQWISEMAFGGGCVNNAAWQFANHYLPFGGVGQSGIGAYHGKYSFERFTHAKPVLKTPLWPDFSFRYPPYAGKLKWFKRLIR